PTPKFDRRGFLSKEDVFAFFPWGILGPSLLFGLSSLCFPTENKLFPNIDFSNTDFWLSPDREVGVRREEISNGDVAAFFFSSKFGFSTPNCIISGVFGVIGMFCVFKLTFFFCTSPEDRIG